jgi:hypothetical protein
MASHFIAALIGGAPNISSLLSKRRRQGEAEMLCSTIWDCLPPTQQQLLCEIQFRHYKRLPNVFADPVLTRALWDIQNCIITDKIMRATPEQVKHNMGVFRT